VAASVKKVKDKFLELREADFALALRIYLVKGNLELILVHVLRLTQECVQLFQRYPLVFIDIDLTEDSFQALLSQELFLIDSYHHELIEGNEAIA